MSGEVGTAYGQVAFRRRFQLPDRFRLQQCECLGQATVNGITADLFICAETVIARFSDRPEDYVATHISHLNPFSDVFLLATFRLHLDAQGLKPEYIPAIHAVPPLKS